MFELNKNVNQSLLLSQSKQSSCDTLERNLTPYCIVIGCKNGISQINSTVKYYQVPNLSQSNHIARQWYINTLREDLLDFINQKNETNPLHFVCVEHFDEESFLITKEPGNDYRSENMIMVLKEDAVPSLFEIEVFQKMIAHQEQFSINQQQKLHINIQQIQSNNIQHQQLDQSQAQPKSSLLNNLILNIEPQQNINNNTQYNNISNNFNNKRTRIDPDTRAALIQRVPKAVKRTALMNFNPNSSSNTYSEHQTQQPKLQKAVKHSFRQITYPQQHDVFASEINNTLTNVSNNNNNNKIQKAVKHTSSVVNSLLKELLPPPIMQSTKRAANSGTSLANKAIKHTASLSILQQNYNNSKQPFTQLNLNSNNNQNSHQSNIPLPSYSNNQTSGNKITITTTYVYKRVSQQPEIDLNLECEEEEIIYVKAPSEPLQLSNSLNSNIRTLNHNKKATESSNIDANKSLKDENKNKQLTNQNEKNNLNIKDPNKNKEVNSNQSNSILIKNNDQNEINESKSQNNINNVVNNKKNENKIIQDLSINNQSQQNKEANKQNLNSMNNNEKRKNYPEIKSQNLNKFYSNAKANIHLNILSKFYSRRLGAICTALELESNSTNKSKSLFSLPADLRIGNYPAKCNVCEIILENNIELTSHICSHLESNSLNENELNTYISPFDAVTTTCGVCEAKFSHPFFLIKHLDSVHMKQLAEYKCRICEKQHDKFNELIDHLNKNHAYQEMPYRCDACGFRTSFYADAIYHIKKEHTNTLRHFCPYCLKSFVLPYNSKLGYVQCNLFYSHLITHFNKHENNQMIPSKCKHCTKCILHVRHIKDHLVYDHTSIQKNDDSETDENEKETNNESILIPDQDKKSNNSNLNITKSNATEFRNYSNNLRKRKRSSNQNDDYNILFNSNTKNELMPKKEKIDKKKLKSEELENDQDEFEISSKADDLKIKRTEPINFKLNSKTLQKNRRSSKTSINSSEYSNLIKKAQSIKSAKCESAEDQDLIEKYETTEQLDKCDLPSSPVYKKKQKALKQTNIKPNINRRRIRNKGNSIESYNNRSPSCSPTTVSNQKSSTLLLGNIKFSCLKNQFKCIECGDSDLKSHYRTDYECHQCKYNTSCSKSFEFHLHGHLVSKRVALWNKKLKTEIEQYCCPCGFLLNSFNDNNSNANTGNKVAEHLLNCEFKYCNFKSIETQNLKKENISVKVENERPIKNHSVELINNEKFNQSDEIIINDSIEEISSC